MKLNSTLITALINTLLQFLSPELIKGLIDKALDFLEDAVEKSENKIDDAIVLPLCAKLREAVSIPDED